MKMRKLVVAVAMAMASSRLFALGLGDIELHSALNEPLNADVRLLAVKPRELDDAVVRLAPDDEFARAGIERPAILSNINFSIIRGKDGAAVLHITSTEPVREPFLDFIVQLSWKSGRLLREYTLLLDPPVFGAEKNTPVTAPVAGTPEMVQAVPVVPANPPGTAPMEAATPVQAVTPQRVTQPGGPAGVVSFASRIKHEKGETTYGRTQRNDTLWSIASSLLPDNSVSVYQMMMALLKENPQAFYDNNVNGLKAGYVLRVPDKSVVAAIDETEAEQEAARQDEQWQQSRNAPLAAGEGGETTPNAMSRSNAAQSTTNSQGNESARLRLVAPGDVSAKVAGPGGGVQEELDKLRSELAIAMESSDTAKRESDELRSRVSDLEGQIASLQRLLALKDESLNELQKRSGMAAIQPKSESTTPALEVPQAAPTKPTPVKPAPVQPAVPKASKPTDIFKDPMFIGAVAGAALLLLSVLWLIVRRRRNDHDNAEDLPVHEEIEEEAISPVPVPVADSDFAQDEHVDTPAEQDLDGSQQMSQVADEIAQTEEQDIPQTASELDALHTTEGDIDPVVEADVYLAYRRYQQAESLVQNALAKQPGRHDLQAKLLEIYYASKNAGSFESVAQSLYDNLGHNSNHALWQRILPMGRELCPNHPLFGDSAKAGDLAGKDIEFDKGFENVGDAESSVEKRSVENQDAEAAAATGEPFELNIGGEAPDAVAPQHERMEFDLNLDEGTVDGSANVVSQETTEVSSKSPNGDSDVVNQFPAAQDEAVSFMTAQEEVSGKGAQENSWEVDPAMSEFGNIDFGLDDADLLAGTDVVGTKLDLARAYIDMGDNDSARDILTEVIEEGNDKQKQEAKGLVEKIA